MFFLGREHWYPSYVGHWMRWKKTNSQNPWNSSESWSLTRDHDDISPIFPDHHPNWYWESWYMVIHLNTITSPPVISMLQLSTKQYFLTNSPLSLSHCFSIHLQISSNQCFPRHSPSPPRIQCSTFSSFVLLWPGAASFCLAAGQGHSTDLGSDPERAEQQQGAASPTCLGGAFEGI